MDTFVCTIFHMLNAVCKTCMFFVSLHFLRRSLKHIDVNECADENMTVCSQICVNSVGTYRCECATGYFLEGDGKTCTKGERGENGIFTLTFLFDCDVELTTHCYLVGENEIVEGRGGEGGGALVLQT